MQISSVLDCFAPVAKPLHITDIEIPSAPGTGAFDTKTAGMWHRQWDETRQSQWLDRFYRIAMSKPFVEAVNYGNFGGGDGGDVAHSGLLSDGLAPKESFKTLKHLHLSIAKR
jgi:hypothetical protein